jgi:hypothetical protein
MLPASRWKGFSTMDATIRQTLQATRGSGPANSSARKAELDPFIIGRGIGPVGRWSRLFLGLYFLTFLFLNPLYLHPVPNDEIVTFAVAVAGSFLLIVALYFAAFYLVGDMILSRTSPWVGTIVFLGLPSALGLLGLLPRPVQMAFGLYVGCSLILIFFMRYGGCEVVGLPSLLLKRRFTLYCPFNTIDALERAVTPDERMARLQVLTIVSQAIVIFVGGYFLLLKWHVLGHDGLVINVDKRWSLLLLVPLAQLTMSTFTHYKQDRDLFAPRVRKFGLGAVVLAVAMVAFLLDELSSQRVWAGAMAVAGLSLLVRSGALVLRRRRLRLAATNQAR